jgi:hypothetical protein
MNKKLTSKIQHLLLIVAMLLNPIIVSADALFSDINDSVTQSTMASTIAPASSGDVEKHASCHDDNSSDSEQSVNADCCEDVCQCSASGCHTTSLTVSSYKPSFVTSTYSINYHRDHYLSFVSSPSSPPPIV